MTHPDSTTPQQAERVEKLLPCPFCKGRAIFADLNSSGFIKCENCGAHGTTCYAPSTLTDPEKRSEWLDETAAHWWNRRPKANDDIVKHMVDRFLRWRLPEAFRPDCGIHFDADAAKKLNPQNHRYEPVGTNLFSADQDEAMVRYMIEGHEWREAVDSMFSNEKFSEVICTKCGCPGEMNNKTHELIWPAT